MISRNPTMAEELNPFTDEYLQAEIDFYDPHPYEQNGLKLFLKPIPGATRMDEYFNKDLRFEGPDIPILSMDGTIWMSLTWMEVQSLWAPIRRARGRVGTAGLGMGYAILRMAAKEEVTEVVVYEVDSRVIKFFNDTQGHRPEMEKITIIEGDVYELMVEEEFDMVLMDPYDTLLPDRVITDAKHFRRMNSIKEYRFWGQEKVLLDALIKNIPVNIDGAEGALIAHWMDMPADRRALYDPIYDDEFVEGVVEVLGREGDNDFDENEED